MSNQLIEILTLENSHQYEKAYDSYVQLYSSDRSNYDAWKHFYFFLWIAYDEDITIPSRENLELPSFLPSMLKEGQQVFAEMADFNFIAGYTISIFPYLFGDYKEMEKIGNEMILKATKLDPENHIYRMAYLGSIENVDRTLYEQSVREAAPFVALTFTGSGILNEYFKDVLYRIDKLRKH